MLELHFLLVLLAHICVFQTSGQRVSFWKYQYSGGSTNGQRSNPYLNICSKEGRTQLSRHNLIGHLMICKARF